MKGVVDSEDLPLSLSREKPQDTALISKIGGVLTKKIIRFLQELMRKEPEKYRKLFFSEFGSFLKEVRWPDFCFEGTCWFCFCVFVAAGAALLSFFDVARTQVYLC